MQQHNDTKLYSLGLQTLEIGTLARRDRFLRSVMVSFLRELSAMCNETVNAAVLEYNEIHYIFSWSPKRCCGSRRLSVFDFLRNALQPER